MRPFYGVRITLDNPHRSPGALGVLVVPIPVTVTVRPDGRSLDTAPVSPIRSPWALLIPTVISVDHERVAAHRCSSRAIAHRGSAVKRATSRPSQVPSVNDTTLPCSTSPLLNVTLPRCETST